MNTTRTLLMGFDFTNGKDRSILIVGRKRPNESVEIINVFEGQEAVDLYEKLITEQERKHD